MKGIGARLLHRKAQTDLQNGQDNIENSDHTDNSQDMQKQKNHEGNCTGHKNSQDHADTVSSNTSLLQIGIVFLAVVSFFTTANGMRAYIFKNDSVIAYAASAAIQSILLALSMNLPGYLKGIWKQTHFWFTKLFLSIMASALTMVTIFCSSWFSYVYIADVIHQDSWDTDSELLVQQTYRSELYNARDYANAYHTYLEEDLGEKILLLQNQASNLPNPINSTITWDQEELDYIIQNGATAASYMTPVISIMRRLFGDDGEQNPTAEQRDLATVAIADAKENIETRMEAIQQNINTLNDNIASYTSRIENISRSIANATEDIDTSGLYASINNYNQLIQQATDQQISLQTESLQLDRTLQRLYSYESFLGLDNRTSGASIRAALLQLQSEFFQPNPDVARLSSIATDIFDSLRTATDSSSDDDNTSSEDSLTYTNLLIQMNQLLRNLTDYATVKGIEADLDGLITQLHPATETPAPNADTALSDSREPSENDPISPDSEGASPAPDESPVDPNDADAPASDETPPEPDEESPDSDDLAAEPGTTATPDSDNTAQDSSVSSSDLSSASSNSSSSPNPKKLWKIEWAAKLEELKSLISAMPAYSGSTKNEESTMSVLTESQINLLLNYDRNESSKALDDMIRRYITNHNAVYEGIIYLQSPYRSLALFALILAFSFDLSGFIFGVVIQGKSSRIQEPHYSATLSPGKNKLAEWGIHETLHRYIVLTGDFEHRDGTYYYKVFRNGLLEEWLVQDESAYRKGIYIQNNEDPKKGQIVVDIDQSLLFAGQTSPNTEKPVNAPLDPFPYDQSDKPEDKLADTQTSRQTESSLCGPIDGIYTNCQLTYDEGGLILLKENEAQQFIASINENVPVHSYNPIKGENQTLPAKQLAQNPICAKQAVVALNTKGTMISAIYIIEN